MITDPEELSMIKLKLIASLFNERTKLSYPIGNYKDLINKIKNISIAGNEIDLKNINRLIPANYFPIFDECDFIDKSSQLCRELINSLSINTKNFNFYEKEPNMAMIPSLPEDIDKIWMIDICRCFFSDKKE